MPYESHANRFTVLLAKEAAHGATETQLASYGCFLTLLLLLLS